MRGREDGADGSDDIKSAVEKAHARCVNLFGCH